MAEQKPHYEQQKDSPELTPADQWRAQIVLCRIGGLYIEDRIGPIYKELAKQSTESLPVVIPEEKGKRLMTLRLHVNRYPGSEPQTHSIALNRIASLLYEALEATGNRDLRMSGAYMQRSSVIEAYDASPQFPDDTDTQYGEYWLEVSEGLNNRLKELANPTIE